MATTVEIKTELAHNLTNAKPLALLNIAAYSVRFADLLQQLKQ